MQFLRLGFGKFALFSLLVDALVLIRQSLIYFGTAGMIFVPVLVRGNNATCAEDKCRGYREYRCFGGSFSGKHG